MVSVDQEATMGPMDQDTTTSIDDWTKSEKYELYKALKSFGSSDIDNVSDCIRSRSKDEVIRAILYYKEMVNNSHNRKTWTGNLSRKYIQKKLIAEGQLPLSYWAKQLLEHKDIHNLQTDTATALRMIADLEPIPAKICTSNIDFRELYKLVADAIDGRPLKSNSEYSAIIEKALVDTALWSKAFSRPSALKAVFNKMSENLHSADHHVSSFQARCTQELKLIEQLLDTGNYNPFKLDEENIRADKRL